MKNKANKTLYTLTYISLTLLLSTTALNYRLSNESKEEKIEETNQIEMFAYFGDMYDADNNCYITYDRLLNDEAFVVTSDNKTYEYLPDESFDMFMAVVAAESNGNRHDSLAVASSILNRCESPNWIEEINKLGKDGTNPIDHITAPGQYQTYEEGKYLEYLNGNVPVQVYDACYSAWYNGIRNNDYCSFRSNDTVTYSNKIIVEGGNRFDDVKEVKSYN